MTTRVVGSFNKRDFALDVPTMDVSKDTLKRESTQNFKTRENIKYNLSDWWKNNLIFESEGFLGQ